MREASRAETHPLAWAREHGRKLGSSMLAMLVLWWRRRRDRIDLGTMSETWLLNHDVESSRDPDAP